jgi:PEP-CTERM motif
MSLLLAAALTVTGPVMPSCTWDRPGVNPFVGDVVAAVDRYQDIPVAVRETLKKRMTARQYDEIATIKRDTVQGAYQYADLRDMHFGKGTICQTVTRERWKPTTQERGLVYCEDGHCLIVPTVCRNVSRVTRVPMQKAQADEGMGPEPAPDVPFLAAVPPGTGELQFDAPAAGTSPSFASGLSGSSPVLPGGSDSGLAGGGSEPREPLSGPTWASSGGLPGPLVVVPNNPGSPGVPGFPVVPGIPGQPFEPGVPPVIPVPEPSTYALLGLGLGLVTWTARRRRGSAQA